MRKEQREVGKAVPTVAIIENTDTDTDASEIGYPKGGLSIGPNAPLSLQLDPEKLARFLDFFIEQRNNETWSWAFDQVATIEDQEVGPPKGMAVTKFCP